MTGTDCHRPVTCHSYKSWSHDHISQENIEGSEIIILYHIFFRVG